VSFVLVLLEAGASQNVKGPDGSSPMEAAETDEIKALLKKYNK